MTDCGILNLAQIKHYSIKYYRLNKFEENARLFRRITTVYIILLIALNKVVDVTDYDMRIERFF